METPHYSPFWPLLLFFVFFSAWLCVEIYDMNVQRVNVDANIAQIAPQTQEAANARQQLIELAQDLATTATHDKTAQQIVLEFNIQVLPAGAPTPTPAK